MNYRCYVTTYNLYHRYGGRGIDVCMQWRWDNPNGFINFLSYVGARPNNHTLDRIDNNYNYCPGNVRWSNKRTQQINQDFIRENVTGHRGVTEKVDGVYTVRIHLYGRPYTILTTENYREACKAYEIVSEYKLNHTDQETQIFIDKNYNKTIFGKAFHARKSSKYFGVCWHSPSNKWRAYYSFVENSVRRQKHLGMFEDEDEAGEAVIEFIRSLKSENLK